MFSLVVTMITAIGTALVLGFGAHYVLKHRMTAGELLVVMGYIASIYKLLEQISHGQQSPGAVHQPAWGTRPPRHGSRDRGEAERLENPGSGGDRLRARQLQLLRDGRGLGEVSFEAPAGTRVAVVGPTGAGKSTPSGSSLAFTTQGSGSADRYDVRDLALESLRAQISIVLQEPLLFSGSIGENIRYGRLEASMDDVAAAARAANAHDFISALPKGYDTALGERRRSSPVESASGSPWRAPSSRTRRSSSSTSPPPRSTRRPRL